MVRGRKKSSIGTGGSSQVWFSRGSVVWGPAAKRTEWPSVISCVYERKSKATYQYLPLDGTNRTFSAPFKKFRILTLLDEVPPGADAELEEALLEAKKLLSSGADPSQGNLRSPPTSSSNNRESAEATSESDEPSATFSSGDVVWLTSEDHNHWPVLVIEIVRRNVRVEFFPLNCYTQGSVQTVPLSACAAFDLNERKLMVEIEKTVNPERRNALQSVYDYKYDDVWMSPPHSPEMEMNVALETVFPEEENHSENGEETHEEVKKSPTPSSADASSTCVIATAPPNRNSGASATIPAWKSKDDQLTAVKIIHFCISENCRRHLLAIWQSQVVSAKHSQYTPPTIPPFRFHPQTGGFLLDSECSVIADSIEQWLCKFPNAPSTALARLHYVFNVALPEAIVHAITQILYCSGAEASRIFEERVAERAKQEEGDSNGRLNRGNSREHSAPFVHLLNAASKARCDSLDSSEAS